MPTHVVTSNLRSGRRDKGYEVDGAGAWQSVRLQNRSESCRVLLDRRHGSHVIDGGVVATDTCNPMQTNAAPIHGPLTPVVLENSEMPDCISL
jgi:hypothetical protein